MISTHPVTVGDSSIRASVSVKSIEAATLDCSLAMANQIAATCKSVWFQLYQISKVRKFLTIEQVKTVIHAYVTCWHNHNNSLFIDLPKKSLSQLQMMQHAAARLITIHI